jgi:hypothetical protein
MLCCCASGKWEGDIVFIGEVVSAKTDGKLIVDNGEKYVKVDAVFRVVEIIRGASEERTGEIEIEYRIMRTDPDHESLKVDKKSLQQLLNLEFKPGNWHKILATYINKKHITKIFSVQQLGVWYK